MKKIDKLIFLLGGEQINKVKNAMLASDLYRFENNIYLSISYDNKRNKGSMEKLMILELGQERWKMGLEHLCRV